MVPGFNHNVTHNGKTYHIQTEDSGFDNPHIITLLYYKGTIVAKKKTSYADILKMDRLPDLVKELMEEQHKAMLRELIRGGFDKGPGAARSSDSMSIPLEPLKTPSEVPPVVVPKAKKQAPKPAVSPAPNTSPLTSQAPTLDTSNIASLFEAGKEEEGEKSLDEIILGYLADENP